MATTSPEPVSRGHSTRRRIAVIAIAAAALLALAAFLPGVALGSVPNATWYWNMVVSPSSPKVLLLGTSSGIYRSDDGGKTWTSAGLTNVNATSLVQAGGTIFVGGLRKPAHASAIVTKNGTYLVTPGQGVFASSSDDGETWHDLRPSGLPNLEIAALAVDPAKTGDLYAVLRTGAVYLSTNGARSFSLVTAKIAGTPWALALTQGSHLVAGDMSNGNYLSTNGKQWQHIVFTDSSGGHMVMEYAVDPADPTHLVMTSYGVVASTDSGKSWHVVLHSKVMFGPIAFASDNSGVAYAVGFNGSLWKSSDRGTSWTEVP